MNRFERKDACEYLLKELETHPIVSVLFDPRPNDVTVPGYLKSREACQIDIGYNMAPSIDDLNVDEDAISGTLSFSSGMHLVVIPWAHVIGIATVPPSATKSTQVKLTRPTTLAPRNPKSAGVTFAPSALPRQPRLRPAWLRVIEGCAGDNPCAACRAEKLHK